MTVQAIIIVRKMVKKRIEGNRNLEKAQDWVPRKVSRGACVEEE